MSLTKVPSSMTSFEGTTFNGEVRSYDSADQGNFVGGASGTANRIQVRGASHPSTPNVITMDTNGSEKLRIDSSGSLLVGTTSADIFAARVTGFGVGPSLAGGQYLNVRSSLNAKWGLTSTSGAHFYFYSDNGSAAVLSGSIYSNGSSTSFNTSSDYRLKEDYQPVTDAIARLNQLKPINFKWKSEDRRCDGFLAHELQEVIPEAATGTKDEVDEEGNPKYQGIDQSKIVPLLTAALQEAVAKIESLTQRIEALEAR